VAEHLAMSSGTNRAKFVSGGSPVDLGTNGATPTGNQPILFLNNAYGTFQNNLGYGGNFTVTGTLADGGTV